MPIPIDTKDIILLLAGGALGYLLSLIAAKQTEKRKNLVLEVVGREIVVEKTDFCPFSIIDETGKNIENVYFLVTRVWNKGRETVRGDEISPTAPLIIEIDESVSILGNPKVMKPHPEMEFDIKQLNENRFSISFDCLNQDEWVQVGFFVTGSPDIYIRGSGRIFGQHLDFDLTMDDSRIGFIGRAASIFAILLFASSPFALGAAAWWAHSDYEMLDLLYNQEKLPKTLQILFGTGLFLPIVSIIYFAGLWLKRKSNPKGYPIREDLEPSQRQSFRALFLTAMTGRRHEFSTSVHNYGEIISTGNKKPATSQKKPQHQPPL